MDYIKIYSTRGLSGTYSSADTTSKFGGETVSNAGIMGNQSHRDETGKARCQ